MLADGGLQKVLSGFDANGLAAQAGSWVGIGENEPISGADVRKVVGDEQLAEIAGELGVSEDEAAAAVAQVLPAVVDAVSPEGHLPPPTSSKRRSRKLGGRRKEAARGERSVDLRSRRAYSRNSPRATVTARPPTSTRSISPSPPSARA